MFFERISASFALARSSWQVLRTDKHLVIFPILSGACCLFVMAAFALPFVAHPEWLSFLDQVGKKDVEVPWWVYVVTFAYYFVNYFVIVFFNSALVSCALIRFNGEAPSVGDGLAAASRRLPQILAWALVSATVGLLLKMIENAHEKAGQIAAAILGTAWSVITFFVVPVIVVEGANPFTAVKRSLGILRHTWGEALVGGWGLGFFVFLLALPGIALIVAAVVAGMYVLPLGIALGVVAGVYFLLLMAVSSALDGIFVGALYQYAAHGEVPSGFEGEYLAHAFRRK
jgi:hypothetical protein